MTGGNETMAYAQKVETAASDAAPLTGLQIGVALLCGLILILDGYDLSTIGLVVPSLSHE
mgnify:CR=1 FL=1